jgi:dynein light intermediate chain
MKMSGAYIEEFTEESILNSYKSWKSLIDSQTTNNKATQHQKKMLKDEIFLQDFLNAVLPPINYKSYVDLEFEENDENQNTKQQLPQQQQVVYGLVSNQQSSRNELTAISEKFDSLIIQRRTRKSGLDNIRIQLALQLYDEVIRQISIDCKERALLLLRIRDEAKLTLTSYAILRNVSSDFSTNMSEQSSRGFEELEKKKRQLFDCKEQLTDELLQLKNEMNDKMKEVRRLKDVQNSNLNAQKIAQQKVNQYLRDLIESKKRPTYSRKKSAKPGFGKRSTRRLSMRESASVAMAANAFSFKSPPTTPMIK